jgi:hypothetical protein
MTKPKECCANCATQWQLGKNGGAGSSHCFVCDNRHAKHFKHTRMPADTCAMWSPKPWEAILRRAER